MVYIAKCETLTEAGEAIARFQAMPVLAQQEQDQARFNCLYSAFNRGIDQASVLQGITLIRRQIGSVVTERTRERMSVWVEVQVGGERGRVYRVGRSPAFNTHDYAQLLIAKRNDMTRKITSGGNILVHNDMYKNGIPGFMSVEPDRFDVRCLEDQMKGALRAYDPDLDNHNMWELLYRALHGDRFESVSPKNRLHSVIYRDMNGELNGS